MTITKPKLREWDPAIYLETEDDTTLYLAAALDEADPALIAAVLAACRTMAKSAQNPPALPIFHPFLSQYARY